MGPKADWSKMYHSSQGMFRGEPWERKLWNELYDEGYRYCDMLKNGRSVARAGLWPKRKTKWMVIAVGTSEKYRGRGYATAVVSCVTERILKSVPKAYLITQPRNIAMQKVAKAVGFRRIRKKREPSAVRRQQSRA